MALNYPLRIEAGATYSRTFKLKNSSDGTLFDLTGYTPKAQIRQHPSTALVLELDVTTDIPNATVTVRIEAADTSTLTESNYYWGCELASLNDTIRLVEGEVAVSPEVVY